MTFLKSPNYRKDIDGLRAIAVLPVLLFHFGFLPNGYLGVDIFFVISGFLITWLIFREIQEGTFSIKDFYIRRTKRILPLVSFVCLVSLIVGIFTMLPDDLENLAQSVIATNFFGNNILQILTTKNYWDVVNEFKPLMHTWSLGIEEQYYLVYPLLFIFFGKKRRNFILPSLILLTLVSFTLYFSDFPEFQKFYLLQFRFYELAAGGVAAILLKGRMLKSRLSYPLLILLLLLLLFETDLISNTMEVVYCTILSVLILSIDNSKNRIVNNKAAIFIGQLSFSLYMWHQVILAFTRYFVFQDLGFFNLIGICLLIFLLSYLSFKYIEQPFRNKKIVPFRKTLTIIILTTAFTTAVSIYIYFQAGVLRDIPELGINKNNIQKNMHAKYNDRIYQMDKDFIADNKIKVLVCGNSFARDWANVLLESPYSKKIDISYIYSPKKSKSFKHRFIAADLVFISGIKIDSSLFPSNQLTKLLIVGTKNFGINNGLFYNYQGNGYCLQRTLMEDGYLESNNNMKLKYGNKYIDIISYLLDKKNTVPIFTPDCKFISQDCRHFTQFGAKYAAHLMQNKIDSVLSGSIK